MGVRGHTGLKKTERLCSMKSHLSSAVNRTWAFLKSASSSNSSLEHQISLRLAAYWTSPAACPLDASDSARPTLSPVIFIGSQPAYSILPHLRERAIIICLLRDPFSSPFLPITHQPLSFSLCKVPPGQPFLPSPYHCCFLVSLFPLNYLGTSNPSIGFHDHLLKVKCDQLSPLLRDCVSSHCPGKKSHFLHDTQTF